MSEEMPVEYVEEAREATDRFDGLIVARAYWTDRGKAFTIQFTDESKVEFYCPDELPVRVDVVTIDRRPLR